MAHRPDLTPIDAIPEEDSPFGLQELGDLLAYVRAALRRRRRAVIALTLTCVALTVAFVVSAPRTYSATVRILALSDYQMPALANPRRAVPLAVDDPTRAAAPMLLSEQNLGWLVDEARLGERFRAHRTLILRLKDQLHDLVFGPLTPEETHDALVKMLQKRVGVEARDHVISIYVSWFDPATTVLIARLLTDRFLDQRRSREVSGITDALAVLEAHATQEKARVDDGLATLRQLRQARRKDGRAAPTRAAAPGVRRPSRAVTAQIGRLSSEITTNERAIQTAEATRQRRLASLQATLAEKQTVLAPGHPDIVALRRSIASLEQPQPEVDKLRSQTDRLRARLVELQRTADRSTGADSEAAHRAVELARSEVAQGDPDENRDPDISSARSQLLNAINAYDDLLGRISSANIELDVAAAAFKYRYSIIGRPKLPEKPDKPNIPVVLVMGLFGGLALSMTFALGMEVVSQRLLLPWQIERQLHLPFLGGVDE